MACLHKHSSRHFAYGNLHCLVTQLFCCTAGCVAPRCQQPRLHDATHVRLCCLCWGTQVAVICGRNKKLLAELQHTQWPGGSHVVACGFVDNIHEVSATDLHLSPASSNHILNPSATRLRSSGATVRGLAAVSRFVVRAPNVVRAQNVDRAVGVMQRCLQRAAVRLSPAGVR